MVAIVKTVAPVGFDGRVIEVESDASNGLPSLQIVGLGNKAIDEAKERVRSAINNSLLEFPKKKITINLAPAELPKDGAHYDLPIALSILAVSGQIKQAELHSNDSVYAGELALDGSVRPVKGVVSIAETAKNMGFKKLFIPSANVAQASLISGLDVFGVESLKDLFLHIKGEKLIEAAAKQSLPTADEPERVFVTAIDDIHGQEQAKRALVIAAAGHHNILLSGSPGTGKTMLAKALLDLLPSLEPDEQLAVTKLHSLAGESGSDIVHRRPFRSPHHTASKISVIGGGNKPKPGEISLAHLGVLFLDEVLEYPRTTLESLRQPLEDKKISVSRVDGHATYPANFMLVATMNPCPCGYYGDPVKECSCTSTQILAYQKKLSGPLMDRIDLRVSVSRVPNDTILDNHSLDKKQHLASSSAIKKARDVQNNRYKSSIKYNSSMTNDDLKKYSPLSKESRQLLSKAADKLGLSARSFLKTIKVARTIADLDDSDLVESRHIAEALQYRS